MAIFQKVRYTDRNESGIDERLSDRMSGCTLCPRMCGADRENGKTGFCGETGEIRAARAALHMWEEPCISGKEGSGAVFFSGCSLGCNFCQNRRISRGQRGKKITQEHLVELFFQLQEQGANNINLVTAGHFLPQVAVALEMAKEQGLHIPVVYNSSGYESVETLRMLEGAVDIYLPDYKYIDPNMAAMLSGARNYPDTAHAAIDEMVRQTGAPVYDQDGMMTRGTLIRHLVLPGLTGDQAIDRIRRTLGYGAYLDDREMDSGKLDILESLGKQTDSPKALLARLRELQGIVAQGSSDPESPFLISTIHSSKGLEYQRVILMDVADGILPSIDLPRGSHPDPEEVELYEEERRLFYVGMTRAKEELAIFRFRREGLESTFANTLFPYDQKVAHPPERESGPREHLSPGDRVDHKIFGPGRIVSRQGDIASIRFEDGTEKRFALAAAVKKKLIRKG